MPFRLIGENLLRNYFPLLAALGALTVIWYFARKKLQKSGVPQKQLRSRDRAFWGLVLFGAAGFVIVRLLPSEVLSRIPFSALFITCLVFWGLVFLKAKRAIFAVFLFAAALFVIFQETLVEYLLDAGSTAKLAKLVSPFGNLLAVVFTVLVGWLAVRKLGRSRV